MEDQFPFPGEAYLLRFGGFRYIFFADPVILLMEEILHHLDLGCIKPCKFWDIYIYLPYEVVIARFLNHQPYLTSRGDCFDV